MNKPSEKTLRLWLEGELEGDRKQEVESWAETNPEELDAEFKCDIGWDALNDECFASMPASEEPPYPEFFNHKILQTIQEENENALESVKGQELEHASSPGLWQKLRWMLAPAAVAAVAAFYAGSVLSNSSNTLADSKSGVTNNSVYLPNSGIVAAVTESSDATEIVLSGLTPVSDELDIAMSYSNDVFPALIPANYAERSRDERIFNIVSDPEPETYMLTKSVRDAIYYY